ncbi:hypothetical protein Tco_0915529 [Tanacetum coccineum]
MQYRHCQIQSPNSLGKRIINRLLCHTTTPLQQLLQISDVCRPFGSDGSFRKWPITAAYNKDTIKMTAVSRTFKSEVAITAAYDSGSLAKQ